MKTYFQSLVTILSTKVKVIILYSESPLRLTTGPHMQTFQPPANPCSDENIQTILGTKLEDFPKLSERLQFDIPNCRKSCEKNIF
jgi:hypothetical protein